MALTKNNSPSASETIPVCRTFEAASIHCGDAYQDQILVQVVAEKTAELVCALEKKAIQFDLDEARRLLVIAESILRVKAARILDYGGACGYYYHLFRRLFSDACMARWDVVETPTMVAAARSKGLERDKLHFNEVLPACDDNDSTLDLAFCCSSLQYAPSPRDTLKAIIALKPKSILLTRTPLSELREEIISVQKSELFDNGPGKYSGIATPKMVSYPITYLPLRQITEILQSEYSKVEVYKERDASVFIDGFPLNASYSLRASN